MNLNQLKYMNNPKLNSRLRFIERPTDKIYMDEHGCYAIATEKVLQIFVMNLPVGQLWEDIPFVPWNPDPVEYLEKVQELKKLPINADHWRFK